MPQPSPSTLPHLSQPPYCAMQGAIKNKDYEKIKNLLESGAVELSEKNYILLSLIVYLKDTKALDEIFSFYKKEQKDIIFLLNLTLWQAVKLKDCSMVEYLYSSSFFSTKEFELAWCHNEYSCLKHSSIHGQIDMLTFLNSVNPQFFLLLSLYKNDWKIKNKQTLLWLQGIEAVYSLKHDLSLSLPQAQTDGEINKV